MKTLAILFAFGLGAVPGTVVTFDSAALGKVPPGWTVAMTDRGIAPKWEIRKDESARTQPYVLAQVSAEPGTRTPLAIFDPLKLRDGDVSVRIKPLSGHPDLGGGVVWRYRDPNNYYAARVNARDKTITVYRVENGKRSAVLAGAHHEIPVNAWSILKVSARGNRFQVYMDHRRIFQGQDGAFSGPGSVGLMTTADSVTYFDDFRVYPK